MLAETINSLYKAEVIDKEGPWRGLEQVELATLDWFNNKRLLTPIGGIPPAEYEDNYCRQIAEDEAAWNKQIRLRIYRLNSNK